MFKETFIASKTSTQFEATNPEGEVVGAVFKFLREENNEDLWEVKSLEKLKGVQEYTQYGNENGYTSF